MPILSPILRAMYCRHINQGNIKLSTKGLQFSTTILNKDYNPASERKMTALEIQHLKRKGRKIAMLTAYDYPSAKHAENAGFDVVLVGDSVGMVVLGYDTTQPVTMEDMLHHCKAVRRGAPSRFIVG